MFPDFRALRLSDKPLLDLLLTRFPPVTSELTFTNLFIWRHAYQIRISRLGDTLCLLADEGGKPFFFPPIGEGQSVRYYPILLEFLANQGVAPKIARVPERAVSSYDWNSAGMAARLDRNQCDYVYLVQDLVQLAGRKYHRKRNHIRQFKEKYSYRYVPLAKEWVDECLRLQTDWCDLRHCEIVPGLANEAIAIQEALSHFQELSVMGGAILIEGKLEAFTLGEPLNRDTIVIHIEKANPAIEGLYPTINQAFLEASGLGFTFVNREQDLGEEGLRKAKESYFPHHLENKYTITPLRETEAKEIGST